MAMISDVWGKKKRPDLPIPIPIEIAPINWVNRLRFTLLVSLAWGAPLVLDESTFGPVSRLPGKFPGASLLPCGYNNVLRSIHNVHSESECLQRRTLALLVRYKGAAGTDFL